MLISCVIDSQEHQDVATIEIPNAFIQTCVYKIEDMATIIVIGGLVDVLVDITPDIYGMYVTEKKGVKTMILIFHNAIYVIMVSSLRYYKTCCKMIKHLGFTINPYDPCVVNRTIDEKHQTIRWHVDDCKISHVYPKIDKKLINSLNQEYKGIFEDITGKMTVKRGKKHSYLGMTLDYSKEGACQITMFKNLKSILETFEKLIQKQKVQRRA